MEHIVNYEHDVIVLKFKESVKQTVLIVDGYVENLPYKVFGCEIRISFLDLIECKEAILRVNEGYEITLCQPFLQDWNEDYTKFVTKIVRSGSNRSKKIFELLRIVNLVEQTHPGYGMALTNLFYRISEDIYSYDYLYDNIVKNKIKQLGLVDATSEESIRWYFSSSLNISLFSIFCDKKEVAKKLLSDLSEHALLISSSPVVLWNYVNSMLILGLLLTREDKNKAIVYFNECFFLSRKTISEMYHPKNEQILTQIHDVEVAIKLGEQALLAQLYCLGGEKKHPLLKQSNYKIGKSQKFTLKPMLKRYRFIPSERYELFTSISNEINDYLEEVR